MSTRYDLAGRIHQKQRTRQALLESARELIAGGVTPTVDSAAAGAAVSRTTAYRYFPSQRTLLVAAHPEIAERSLLPDSPPQDPEARLDLVIQKFTRLIVETERQQRTMLRLSLEPDPSLRGDLPLRQGRAIGWIAEALAPLRARMPAIRLQRLVMAIRSATGIEALVWLTDIGELSREEAVEVMRGSARALLRSALADLDVGDRQGAPLPPSTRAGSTPS